MTGPLAGEPRERRPDRGTGRRAGAWFAWWVLMTAFWVAIDDSLGLAEVLAGAGAGALAALLAEMLTYQAAIRLRLRARWLAAAVSLPGQVAGDTVLVYRALWRRLTRGQTPASGFVELPVRPGDDSAAGQTRRTLLIGATSLAPNTFVLGIDTERHVMVVHQLVTTHDTRRGT